MVNIYINYVTTNDEHVGTTKHLVFVNSNLDSLMRELPNVVFEKFNLNQYFVCESDFLIENSFSLIQEICDCTQIILEDVDARRNIKKQNKNTTDTPGSESVLSFGEIKRIILFVPYYLVDSDLYNQLTIMLAKNNFTQAHILCEGINQSIVYGFMKKNGYKGEGYQIIDLDQNAINN